MTKRRSDDHEEQADAPQGERLQRVLAQRGVASRRASEELITAGRVQVNGKTVTELGTRVDPVRDQISVDGKTVRRQRPRFIVLNKPSGFITTVSDEKQRWTVMDLVNVEERVYPVGRLDRETQGILLLTNVGEVANRVMHPRFRLSKEYHVVTDKKPTNQQLQTLREGILIEGRVVVPDECRMLRETPEGFIIKMVIHEGMYHVVRYMMDAVGIDVKNLRRVRIGPLTLTGIPPGAWRDLTPGELLQLYEAVGLPAEDADQVNARRPQQLIPVGGFQHMTPVRHPHRVRREDEARQPRSGDNRSSGSRSGDGSGRTSRDDLGPERPSRKRGGKPDRRDSREGSGFGPTRDSRGPGGPSRRTDGPRRGTSRPTERRDSGKPRSPQGHRDRRSGGGR
jgi:23S rRNA pseudouridine2605 synthase